MTTYLLTSDEYKNYQVHGAFASIEDAERAKFLWGFEDDDSAQIGELEVLTIPPLPRLNELEVLTIPPLPKLDKELKPFTVSVYVPFEYPVYVEEGWYNRTSVEESYTFEEKNQKYKFYLFAMYEEDAKKKARAKLLSL